ncbi:HD domain-containing protein [Salinibacter ruber]|uniref:HD domain-containing protein n=1 Tax=Salinibacter ruber TaxID=146919 RepID=UPI000E6D2185|nr:HD domain-containing protein [Salinibacter ruber]
MPTLEDAISLAAEAHAGQTDKAGEPYVLHLLRVMQSQDTKEAMMAGVLHDLIEDTELDFDDLRERGYPNEVIEALRHLTKRADESYQEFVDRASQHPISRWVKISDLEDNMDVTRLDSITEADARRLKKYRRSHKKLVGQDGPGGDGSGPFPSADRKRRALIEMLQNRTPEMENWIGWMGAPNPPYERKDFVWHYLLQSFATWGNSRGHDGLIGTDENYQRVTYEVLEGIPTERRPDHIEKVLRDAKVRYPGRKSQYLSENVEIVRKMDGLQAVRERALDQTDAEAKIEFVKQFKGIGDKYARNFWMDVRHPDFENKVALDQRIRGITELLGRQFESYEAEEQFYLEVAEEAGLTGWELDRLLYNFTDRFERAIEEA